MNKWILDGKNHEKYKIRGTTKEIWIGDWYAQTSWVLAQKLSLPLRLNRAQLENSFLEKFVIYFRKFKKIKTEEKT